MTQCLRYAFVVRVNRVAEARRIIGNDGIRQFVVVQYGSAPGWPMDDINPMLIAVFLVDRALDSLISTERNGWTAPLIEPDDRLRRIGFSNFVQKRRIDGHV
jgi:hypothetical protein